METAHSILWGYYKNTIRTVYDLFIRVIKAGSSPSALTEGLTDSTKVSDFNAEVWCASQTHITDCRRGFIPVKCRLVQFDATSAPKLRGNSGPMVR